MILLASVIGAALPFCSVSVIPLAAGLLGAGVPLAPVVAFWMSSPLMDPTQFFIASGVLGIGFASAKMLSAVGVGTLGGFGTMMLVRAGWLDADLAPSRGGQPSSAQSPRTWIESASECANRNLLEPPPARPEHHPEVLEADLRLRVWRSLPMSAHSSLLISFAMMVVPARTRWFNAAT